MKTLFGMTAAVLLVVTMLFVSLPRTVVANDECTLGADEYEYRTLPDPIRNEIKPSSTPTCLNDYTEYRPNMKVEIYQKQKRRKVCILFNGKATWQYYRWKKDGVERKEIGPAPGGITTSCGKNEKCENGQGCIPCPPAGKMLQVISGAQKACGCTACNECERCVNKSCVPIKNVSPSSPQCIE